MSGAVNILPAVPRSNQAPAAAATLAMVGCIFSSICRRISSSDIILGRHPDNMPLSELHADAGTPV
ncbi:MAG: hypothetical protein LBT62_01455 [Deltaproteobacteria bacterium]|nr:hypothetical protein [Deltaproteobacteria bacterium]